MHSEPRYSIDSENSDTIQFIANVIPSPAPTNADSPQGSIAYGIILTDIFQNRRSNGRKV
ncbi:unnamed protein product [Brassica rapa subsp. narinosa]